MRRPLFPVTVAPTSDVNVSERLGELVRNLTKMRANDLRMGDAFAALIALVGERDDLSEGQLVAVTGIDRLSVRELQDYGQKLLDDRPEVRPVWRKPRDLRALRSASDEAPVPADLESRATEIDALRAELAETCSARDELAKGLNAEIERSERWAARVKELEGRLARIRAAADGGRER